MQRLKPLVQIFFVIVFSPVFHQAQAQMPNIFKQLEGAAKPASPPATGAAQAPVQQAPVQQAPVQQAPVQQAPVQQAAPQPTANDRNQALDELLKAKEAEYRSALAKSKESAAKSKTRWIATVEEDQMSGSKKVSVMHSGKKNGASYQVKLSCTGAKLSAEFSVFDGMRVPNERLQGQLYAATGRERVNGKVSEVYIMQSTDYNNVFKTHVQDVYKGIFAKQERLGWTTADEWKVINMRDDPNQYVDCRGKSSNACYFDILPKTGKYLPQTFVYDEALELPTNKGAIFVSIPPADNEIQKLLATCK
jgi:hypothetical protein